MTAAPTPNIATQTNVIFTSVAAGTRLAASALTGRISSSAENISAGMSVTDR